MKKLCFLLDPSKKEVEQVFGACCLLKDIVGEKFIEDNIEFWVGCTTASGHQIRDWVLKLRKEVIGPRVIFPGKVSQALLGYPHTDYLMAIHLLNWSKKSVFIEDLLGLVLTKLFSKRIDLGYLVLSSDSTIGRRVGAKNLNLTQALTYLKKYLHKHPSAPSIYLEAGSGASRTVSLSLVKKVHKLLKKYESSCLIVAGGIRNKKTAEKFFRAGADKILISTILEQSTVEKSLKVMLEFLSLVK
ncbi:MAG: geranylgeranylglyceryl/heptaprenylglyceryl phosphate synthase [Candidatus Aenigmarchaeota archaeon]|nr:geranylgeranylglyceryl/heptaprenylglyceryl phosphate synthase [Candidatus Aenigmarchaeota archaeon]